jgi:hypothetical protein
VTAGVNRPEWKADPLLPSSRLTKGQVLLIHGPVSCKWNLLLHLVHNKVDVDVVDKLHSSSRLEVSDVLESGATSLGDYYPTFRDIAMVSFSGVKCQASCTFRPLKTNQDVSKRRGPIVWHGTTTQKSGDLNCRAVKPSRPATSDIYKLRNAWNLLSYCHMKTNLLSYCNVKTNLLFPVPRYFRFKTCTRKFSWLFSGIRLWHQYPRCSENASVMCKPREAAMFLVYWVTNQSHDWRPPINHS